MFINDKLQNIVIISTKIPQPSLIKHYNLYFSIIKIENMSISYHIVVSTYSQLWLLLVTDIKWAELL